MRCRSAGYGPSAGSLEANLGRFSPNCLQQWRPTTLQPVYDLPALLLAGGVFGDFLGGLLIFASIISMLEFTFEFEGSPEKRSKQ